MICNTLTFITVKGEAKVGSGIEGCMEMAVLGHIQYNGTIFLIYSVMNKRDQYHLALHPHSIENKIKQLEQKGEQQSLKVRELLYRPTSPRPSDRQSHLSPLPQSSRSPRREHPPQTLKKAQPHSQINYQEVASIRQRIQRQLLGQQQKMPLPTMVEFNANRDQDQQMQYLKSQEYKKYLDSLTKATSKQERVRLIKENRNHNVYMGKGINAERRTYNGEVSRRINRQYLESARNQHSYERSPLKIWEREQFRQKNGKQEGRDRRATEYQREKGNHYEDEYSANTYAKRETKERRDVDQDYIRSVYEYFEATISPKSNYPNEHPSAPSSNRNNLKKSTQQYFPKPSKSPSTRKPQKESYQPRKNKETIQQTTSKDIPANILTSNASNIYKQEVEFCKKRINNNEKPSKTKRQAKQKYGYTYRIVEDDKENYDSKSEQSTPRLSNQSRPQKENIYDISFKIQKPNQAKPSNRQQQYYKATPQLKVKRDHSAKIIKSHTQISYNKDYEEKHHQCTISPLQTSQTRSTTTKTDCASKSSRKISVISRSKLKL